MFSEQHPTSDLPFDTSKAAFAGKRLAAGIAGPLLTGDARPGAVEFIGPADIGDAAAESSGQE